MQSIESDFEHFALTYPLIYKHSRNYAAKLIQQTWKKYMAKVTYKYFLQCCKDFEQNLEPKDLSRIYPEFLENSDSKISAKLQIKMQGVSFPPTLVCRVIGKSTPSIGGGRHVPKWIPLFSTGSQDDPINQRALVKFFLEAVHLMRENSSTKFDSKKRVKTLRMGTRTTRSALSAVSSSSKTKL